MERVSKPPEIRKLEILETAMGLFSKKGYESTSMADIAKELHVVQGLCYRYFPSKQALFEAAMEQYVAECCAGFVQIIRDRSETLGERLNRVAAAMQHQKFKYADFYHQPANRSFHEQLSIRMCQYMVPHVTEEFLVLCEQGLLKLENPQLTVEFLLYGQIGMLQRHEAPSDEELQQMRQFVNAVLGIAQ